MDRFEKAADFGKSMGTAAGALLGAGIGGGGTALYDWIRGNKQNRLRRALIGAGIGGGLGGAGGFIAGAVNDNKREAFNKEYDVRQAMQKADREVLRQREALRMQKLKYESNNAHEEEMARRNAWKFDPENDQRNDSRVFPKVTDDDKWRMKDLERSARKALEKKLEEHPFFKTYVAEQGRNRTPWPHDFNSLFEHILSMKSYFSESHGPKVGPDGLLKYPKADSDGYPRYPKDVSTF